MKAYTDIEQSRKLTEILPLESADMCYGINDDTLEYNDLPWLIPYSKYTAKEFYVPCWSLAALLSVISDFPALTQEGENEWKVCVRDYNNDEYIEITADNPVDACVNMILKLKDLNLL